MNTELNNKYWEDYSIFIKEVESLTGLSPSDLLTRYKALIAELTDNDEEYFLEWQYEFDDDLFTRKKIQMVLEHNAISDNTLLKSFKEEIELLDLELKKYILNSDQPDWWENPKLIFKRN